MTQTLGRAAILFIAITLAASTAPKPPTAPDTGAVGPAYRQATVTVTVTVTVTGTGTGTGTGNDAIDIGGKESGSYEN